MMFERGFSVGPFDVLFGRSSLHRENFVWVDRWRKRNVLVARPGRHDALLVTDVREGRVDYSLKASGGDQAEWSNVTAADGRWAMCWIVVTGCGGGRVRWGG